MDIDQREHSVARDLMDRLVDVDGRPPYLALDSGRHGAERHLLPVESAPRATDGSIVCRSGRERIAAAPRVEGDDGLSLDDLGHVHEHDGLASHEDVIAARQASPAPTPEIARAELASDVRSGGDPLDVAVRSRGV
jgi:hypothetical protein